MKENAIYFAKNSFYDVIRNNGGQWCDTKERPLVCLMEDENSKGLYWAIPIGAWKHRNPEAQERIMRYINSDNKLQSCYYHIGNTTQKSIFFISDAVPITDKYIEREYIGYDKNQYIIKNRNLIEELNRKLKIILNVEKNSPCYFRQHITDIKKYLLNEMQNENKSENF